ncbi:dephospho-CoA kinase [Phormidesmis priestleyi ULC007]|uniref:Dephospho-CoA kinase n=2 Tax=Phormidesmis priestleyi TaxID=268141 RepID=A0A2T1DDE2_9CYAN|nr:dephospho-CoA kinase [Phormidesmis priestleyi]PSB18486.1 dephospho-CoA kinase [Phormidesmis priestleyi ULC007]PZO48787.1 MAG: dephospho-CoA kinase [Phormidesmis priestleyi]
MSGQAPSPRIIGLTGGIGMGKTTVSDYLDKTYQLPILDADIYAREAVQPGSIVLEAIVNRYQSKILLLDGTLDRRQLGEIIFTQPSERIWLDEQIHPYVRQALSRDRDRLIQHSHQTIVLVIPLLFEAQMTDLITEIWVVSCSPDQQIQRLMQRGALSLEQANARINSQMAIAEKRDRADVVLENTSTLEDLLEQVDRAIDHPFSPNSTKSYG